MRSFYYAGSWKEFKLSSSLEFLSRLKKLNQVKLCPHQTFKRNNPRHATSVRAVLLCLLTGNLGGEIRSGGHSRHNWNKVCQRTLSNPFIRQKWESNDTQMREPDIKSRQSIKHQQLWKVKPRYRTTINVWGREGRIKWSKQKNGSDVVSDRTNEHNLFQWRQW